MLEWSKQTTVFESRNAKVPDQVPGEVFSRPFFFFRNYGMIQE